MIERGIHPGRLVRRERRRKGWSQTTAARMHACSPWTFGSIETGWQVPGDRLQEALYDHLGIDPAVWVGAVGRGETRLAGPSLASIAEGMAAEGKLRTIDRWYSLLVIGDGYAENVGLRHTFERRVGVLVGRGVLLRLRGWICSREWAVRQDGLRASRVGYSQDRRVWFRCHGSGAS